MKEQESRACRICGNSLYGMHIRAKYCSDGCRTEAGRQQSLGNYYRKKDGGFKYKTIKNRGISINHWAVTALMTSTALRQIATSTGVTFKKDMQKATNRPPEEKEIIKLKDISKILEQAKKTKWVQSNTIRLLEKLETAIATQELYGRHFDIEYQRVVNG